MNKITTKTYFVIWLSTITIFVIQTVFSNIFSKFLFSDSNIFNIIFFSLIFEFFLSFLLVNIETQPKMNVTTPVRMFIK